MNSGPRNHTNDELIRKLTEIVIDNLTNEQFGVSALAAEMGMSRSNLHRKVTLITNKSLSQFIREIRLNEAYTLLKNNGLTVAEAAYNVGFSNPSYFSSCFHEYFGYPPGEAKLHDEDPFVSVNIEKEAIKKSWRIASKRNIVTALIFTMLLVIISTAIVLSSESKTRKEIYIAILPFTNLSSDPDNAYFAVGLVDDLINRLSGIDSLRVVSLTSASAFMEKGTYTIPEMARELRVDYILEGSVQRAFNTIKVKVRLIDGMKDIAIISRQFDRDLSQVFSIQSEMSMQIASELTDFLKGSEKKEIRNFPTRNLAAFDNYAMGKYYEEMRTAEDCRKSIEYFKEAIREDTEYAMAYAGLSKTYFHMTWHAWINYNEGKENAIDMAIRALEKDPDLCEAHAVLGAIYTSFNWEWEKANKELLKAMELNPNNADAPRYWSTYCHITNQHDQALQAMRQACRLDPYSFTVRLMYAKSLARLGQFEEALEEINRAQELIGFNRILFGFDFMYLYKLGREKEAVESLYQYEKIGVGYKSTIVDSVYSNGGMNALIRHIIDVEGFPPNCARWYLLLGEEEAALDILEQNVFEHPAAAIFLGWFQTQILYDNPRFKALIDKMGLTPYYYPE